MTRHQARHRREQRLGVRVMGTGEDRPGRPVLHHPAQIEHGDAVGEIAHHSEVVRDEDIAHALAALQVGEEIEDGRLHRDVEC